MAPVFADLPNGIPTHDTFGRVFAALDPVAFETAFLGWERTLVTRTEGAVEAIDGKTVRRSHDRAPGQNVLHSSPPGDATTLGQAVRAHWVLDMAFREDESRVRAGHAAENLAMLRRLVLTLLKRETTAKVGVKAKRLMCGWDEPYHVTMLVA